MLDHARPQPHDPALLEAAAERAALQDVGRLFYDRGWSLGTSGNYSVVLSREPLRLLITASGSDKRCLSGADFVIVDDCGAPATRGPAVRPSAETSLHVAAARQAGAGAILHTHSVWATLLSDIHFPTGFVEITGYEMLKGLAGIATHESTLRVHIFDNTQNMPLLAEQVSGRLVDRQLRYGFLIRNHGLYAWGRDLAEARRHTEILEFLLEVAARRLALSAQGLLRSSSS